MGTDEKASTPLLVAGGRAAESGYFSIEIDEYVPMRLRTYSKPLGASYVRLGDHEWTLVEIIVQPHIQVVRGLTVTSFRCLATWPLFSIVNAQNAFPIISTSFEGGESVDLDKDFSVSVRSNEIIVFWGALGPCDSYASGRANFLVNGGNLTGVWLTDFSEQEMAVFRSYSQREY